MRIFLAFLKIRFLNLKDAVPWLLLSGVLFPFLILFFARQLAGDVSAQVQLLGGAITASVVLNAIFFFGQSFASQRARGEYEIFATLPIPKFTFIIGTLTANLLVSLANATMLLVVAVMVFGFDIRPSLWLFPSLILGTTSVVGIGLLIGVLSRNTGEAALVCSIAVYVLSYATPIFYPLESLPHLLQWVSIYLPTTHAALAVKQTLFGPDIPTFSLTILSIWTVLILTFVMVRLDWRLK
jgi:ABC-2 type transport system permease protein